LTREVVHAGLRERQFLLALIRANYKTNWAPNEDAVETQFAVLYTADFVLIDKALMNELNVVINT
jgi:hypothetical protein